MEWNGIHDENRAKEIPHHASTGSGSNADLKRCVRIHMHVCAGGASAVAKLFIILGVNKSGNDIGLLVSLTSAVSLTSVCKDKIQKLMQDEGEAAKEIRGTFRG